ncbi:hypothetical protein [Methanoregula sp.]
MTAITRPALEIIPQEELDAMQDPIATAVVVQWVIQGKAKIIPRGQSCRV